VIALNHGIAHAFQLDIGLVPAIGFSFLPAIEGRRNFGLAVGDIGANGFRANAPPNGRLGAAATRPRFGPATGDGGSLAMRELSFTQIVARTTASVNQ
jgi:hypothetical protein